MAGSRPERREDDRARMRRHQRQHVVEVERVTKRPVDECGELRRCRLATAEDGTGTALASAIAFFALSSASGGTSARVLSRMNAASVAVSPVMMTPFQRRHDDIGWHASGLSSNPAASIHDRQRSSTRGALKRQERRPGPGAGECPRLPGLPGRNAPCAALPEPLHFLQLGESRRLWPWVREGLEETRICAGDEPCHNEERRHASTQWYARQTVRNCATSLCSLPFGRSHRSRACL